MLYEIIIYIGEKDTALKYYEEWLILSKKNKHNKHEEEWYSKIWNRYKNNNNRKEAYRYKELEDSVRNKIINEESIKQINELNIKHETEKKNNK